jgi:hypothetical protein
LIEREHLERVSPPARVSKAADRQLGDFYQLQLGEPESVQVIDHLLLRHFSSTAKTHLIAPECLPTNLDTNMDGA